MFPTDYKFHHNFPQLARESGFLFREPNNGNGTNTIDWRWIGKKFALLNDVLILRVCLCNIYLF